MKQPRTFSMDVHIEAFLLEVCEPLTERLPDSLVFACVLPQLKKLCGVAPAAGGTTFSSFPLCVRD